MKIKISKETKKKLLKEISSTTGMGGNLPDDGPNWAYSDFNTYKNASDSFANQLGFKVINYLSKKDDIETFGHEKMGNDGAEIKPIDKDEMKKMAKIVGYEVIEKYLKKMIKEELINYLKENDIEYKEHIIIDEE